MDIEQEIADMKAQIAELRAQIWRGEPRLGPRPETPEEAAAKASRLAEVLIQATKATKAVEETNAPALCTTNGKTVAEVRANQTNETGQHDGYIVLCPDERAKGFVRPYRDRYKHSKCGTVTTMGRDLSETYARQPSFYSHTFCVSCNRHLPVSEFTWTADDQVVGS